MTKNVFIFCHGFGFDPSFWAPLMPFFLNQNVIHWDLGYFGDETRFVLQEDVNYIGIGHSLGFMKLLSLPISYHHLIGLHGFTNFLGNEPTLRALRTREWMSLMMQFKRSPSRTLQHFYQRVGVTLALEGKSLRHSILQNDLQALEQAGALPTSTPVLMLGAQDDWIVPPALIVDNFSNHPNVRIELLNHGQHGLGFLNPETVYRHILGCV